MCSFFGISRAAYYAWHKRLGEADKDAQRKALVLEAYQASKGAYGYRRIEIWIASKKSIKINHKAVLRLMNKLGLQSVARRRRAYPKPGNDVFHVYQNILQRDFKASRPNQKWSTDITYIPTQQGWAYLSVIKDLYDGFVVAYVMSQTNSIGLVTRTLKKALANEKVTDGLVLHSDQGHQYSSHAYYVLTKEYSIIPSMSRRGNCLDNAPVENFFGHLKEESIRQFPILPFDQVRSVVDEYIYFYNYERIQLKSKQTPFELRCLFL